MSVPQKNDLFERRRKLEARITAYEQRMSVLMKCNDDTQWAIQDDKAPEGVDTFEEGSDTHPDGWFTPERERLTLPSALAPGEVT